MDGLKHLIGAYFYELWDQHEYESWENAIDDFVRRSPAMARGVPDEIEDLMAQTLSDDELASTLAQWGFDNNPVEGERAWLLHVRDRIRAKSDAGST